MTDDNGAGLRALFYGLCSLWDISVRAAEDPSDPSDFALPGMAGPWPAYVVILPEPAARQVEIDCLLHYGNKVLVLDERDLDEFRTCPGGASAGFMIERWVTTGDTHAARERQRLGLPARSGEGS